MKNILEYISFCFLLAFVSMTYAQEDSLAFHCPKNYVDARMRFQQIAASNTQVTEIVSLPIAAKGPQDIDLSIDIAVLGNLEQADKVLFVISGTHGVEGGVGSGIQQEFLSNAVSCPSDTAMVFIHVLNPFGMAWNRRVNEENIDLNRNGISERITPSLYKEIDPLYNPKSPRPFDGKLFQELCEKYSEKAVRSTLLEGQYSFPKGLFYGGEGQSEEPFIVLNWCRDKISHMKNAKRFGIIDIHSGLGPYGVDTLLTYDCPTKAMRQFFGKKMDVATQLATSGYTARGLFNKELVELIQQEVPSSQVFAIGQEFGTISEVDVIAALYEENMLFHSAEQEYDPEGASGKAMLRAFYPEDDKWRHATVSAGRDLILQSLQFLQRLPYEEGYLKVSEVHEIYYAVYGNPQGIPAVVLHGGPGIGCNGSEINYFDLNQYKVVLLDQRGAMRSKPFACMEDNTTQELIEDLEKLRHHLQVDKWLVLGCSWGSLLSVLYGETYPDSCLGFVLQGIFLGRSQDIQVLSKSSQDYETLTQEIPEREGEEYLCTCYRALMHKDPKTHMLAAKAFARYFFSRVGTDRKMIDVLLQDDQAILSSIRCLLHYVVHKFFIEEGQSLQFLDRIKHLPAVIVHGTADKTCNPDQALTLQERWPSSHLMLLEGVGHSKRDPKMEISLRKATTDILSQISFGD